METKFVFATRNSTVLGKGSRRLDVQLWIKRSRSPLLWHELHRPGTRVPTPITMLFPTRIEKIRRALVVVTSFRTLPKMCPREELA